MSWIRIEKDLEALKARTADLQAEITSLREREKAALQSATEARLDEDDDGIQQATGEATRARIDRETAERALVVFNERLDVAHAQANRTALVHRAGLLRKKAGGLIGEARRRTAKAATLLEEADGHLAFAGKALVEARYLGVEHELLAAAHGSIGSKPTHPGEALGEWIGMVRRHRRTLLMRRSETEGAYACHGRAERSVRALTGREGGSSYSRALSTLKLLSGETVDAAAPWIRERLERLREATPEHEREKLPPIPTLSPRQGGDEAGG